VETITEVAEPEGGSVDVQIFGVQKSADTRKALRFFKERRVNVHFVDLKVRAASKGELTRFVQKFGADALLDRDSKRFRDLGLNSAFYSEKKWLELLVEEPLLLKVPLVRNQNLLSVGLAEEVWKEWVK
jgi:arsenate reductase-like glutaredoxin family protein